MQLQNRQLFRQQAFINGQWLDSPNQQTLAVDNPATGEIIGSVPMLTTKEAEQAILAAQQAQPAWAALTAKQRADILRKWFNLIMQNQDDLALIMTLEQGKPLNEAKGEISYAASFVEWFAEEGKRIYGDTHPIYPAGSRVAVIKQPIGVCAAITPWNFPAAMITRKAAPALAAGCTMILKPSLNTPFSALALAELASQAGIPAGVFNIVTGEAESLTHVLTQHPTVRKLSFTGSTRVGSILMADCAKDVKKLSLELGGNAPFIVFEDADIDAAVDGAVIAKFRNAGQTCICVNRFYIHDSVYDTFVEKLTQKVAKLKVGDGRVADTDIGPLINQQAVNKVLEHIDDAVSLGAKVAYGGKVLNNNFIQPTILIDTPYAAKVSREETFGPLAALFRFQNDQQVIQLANDTEYGLAAYFYTANINRLFKISEALEYGMIGVNTGAISTETIPFGGVKSSGLGREGSRYGIDEYLEIKCISIGGIKG